MRDGFLGPRVMRKRWADDPELFEAASPLLRVTADAPDFFVLHGAHDTLVEVEQARLFVARLREVSRRSVVYAELPGAQHAFDVFTLRAVRSRGPRRGPVPALALGVAPIRLTGDHSCARSSAAASTSLCWRP